eukprot:GHVH01008302.1.p2 GENE.GHVH01008302.1~~GHVH01008302.1.p2  ORF type:complete len:105 (-),score=12.67 GHVH01008302.1:142-456(-)
MGPIKKPTPIKKNIFPIDINALFSIAIIPKKKQAQPTEVRLRPIILFSVNIAIQIAEAYKLFYGHLDGAIQRIFEFQCQSQNVASVAQILESYRLQRGFEALSP